MKQTIKLLGSRAPAAIPTPGPPVTRHTIAEYGDKGSRILLVEDYPTNQQVAASHLRNAGHMVDLAENGQEAVDAFDRNAYALILMDMQMPVLDGYEATRRIRKIEAATAAHGGPSQRIPIIAMTAHSLEGDREKCLAAGADDYITKPLKKKNLLTIVDRWADPSEIHADEGLSPVESPHRDGADNPIDYRQVLEEFDNDPEFLMEVLSGFIENLTAQTQVLRKAIVDGDCDGVAKETHSIKGGASNLTAAMLAEAAATLEKAGRSEDLTGAAALMDNLEKEIGRLGGFVETLDTAQRTEVP